jgi:hypothetical protein
MSPVLDALQWPGMALGLLGAWWVASPHRHVRARGFLVWIASNACWIAWSIASGGWGLLIMQTAFCATSCLGWWNHRKEPDA